MFENFLCYKKLDTKDSCNFFATVYVFCKSLYKLLIKVDWTLSKHDVWVNIPKVVEPNILKKTTYLFFYTPSMLFVFYCILNFFKLNNIPIFRINFKDMFLKLDF